MCPKWTKWLLQALQPLGLGKAALNQGHELLVKVQLHKDIQNIINSAVRLTCAEQCTPCWQQEMSLLMLAPTSLL